jgi:hypothetical protein
VAFFLYFCYKWAQVAIMAESDSAISLRHLSMVEMAQQQLCPLFAGVATLASCSRAACPVLP